MERCALLLRAVNVSGRNRVPMAELRTLLRERTSLTNVTSYIASGNIVCDAPAHLDAARADVRALIAREFGVDTPVIARTHTRLAALADEMPFPDAAEKLLHVMFLEGTPAAGAEAAIRAKLVPGEDIAFAGNDLWIRYADGGVHTSKLTKAVLDRALGTAGTARNVRTLRALATLTA